MARAHYAIHSPVRTTGKISGRRKSRRVLLTSLNMLQHPSATRSIASLGRSIPMPVRQYPLIPSTLVHPPVLSTSPLSQPCPAPPSTDHPIPPPLLCAFYRRLRVTSVADRPQPSRFIPIATPVPPQLSRPPSSDLNDVTACPTLRSAKFISQ